MVIDSEEANRVCEEVSVPSDLSPVIILSGLRLLILLVGKSQPPTNAALRVAVELSLMNAAKKYFLLNRVTATAQRMLALQLQFYPGIHYYYQDI